MVFHLQDDALIGKGNRRLVFAHPDDPSLIIKVIKPREIPLGRRLARRRLRYIHTSNLLRELREHILLRMADPEPPWFLQKIVGLADTQYGLGLVAHAERGRDGKYAKSLHHLLKSGGFDAHVRDQLDLVLDAILASDVVADDVTAANLVYSYTPERGDHFVLIDGIGTKTWIPVQSLSAGISRFRKRRMLAALRSRANRALKL